MENRPRHYKPNSEQSKPAKQPSQPEHVQPLQGRAEGRQSLQGPTTVDGSEHLLFSTALPLSPHDEPSPHSEGAQDNPPVESVQLSEVLPTKLNCVLPAITKEDIRRHDSLYVIRERLRDQSLTKRQAERLEQKWRKRLKKMDRLTIKEKLYRAEKFLKESKQLQKDNGLTAHRQALIPAEEEEVEVLREELGRREAD